MVQVLRSTPAKPVIDVVDITQENKQEEAIEGSAIKKPRKAKIDKKLAKTKKKATMVNLTNDDEDDDGCGSSRWTNPKVHQLIHIWLLMDEDFDENQGKKGTLHYIAIVLSFYLFVCVIEKLSDST